VNSITYDHLPWEKETLDVNELCIDVAGDIQAATSDVLASLKRYGFALLSGMGGRNERSVTADELLELASHLGTVVPQSPRGEYVEDVRDFSDTETEDKRGYRSRGELTPHSDPPTLIALHCIRPAKSGGESYIVNVRSIHDRIKSLAPKLLTELYKGFPHWRVEGQHGIDEAGPAPDFRPIFAVHGGAVSCMYYRPYIKIAAKALGMQFTEEQRAALDCFDECASSPDLAVRFSLRAGQTLVLHNRTVLHARTDYEDWPDSDRRRHLLRVWIDAPNLLPVSPQHELGNLFT
jgi:hypothetical protein